MTIMYQPLSISYMSHHSDTDRDIKIEKASLGWEGVEEKPFLTDIEISIDAGKKTATKIAPSVL